MSLSFIYVCCVYGKMEIEISWGNFTNKNGNTIPVMDHGGS
jgi:hypothetical protein